MNGRAQTICRAASARCFSSIANAPPFGVYAQLPWHAVALCFFYRGNRPEPADLLPSGAFPAMAVRPLPLANSVLNINGTLEHIDLDWNRRNPCHCEAHSDEAISRLTNCGRLVRREIASSVCASQ